MARKIETGIALRLLLIQVVSLALVLAVVAVQVQQWLQSEAQQKMQWASRVVQLQARQTLSQHLNGLVLARNSAIAQGMAGMETTQPARELALKLKSTGELLALDKLVAYDNKGALAAFYLKEGPLYGWRNASGSVDIQRGGRLETAAQLPQGITKQYPRPIGDTRMEFEGSDRGIELVSALPVITGSTLDGALVGSSYLDNNYAIEVLGESELTVEFFVDGKATGTSGLAQLSDSDSKLLSEIATALADGSSTENYLSTQYEISGRSYYAQLYPLITGSKMHGVLAMMHPKELVAQKTLGIMLMVGLVLVLAGIAGNAIAIGFARRFAEAMKEAERVSLRLAEGDLTQEVSFKRQDEAGPLLTAMQEMLKRLRVLVKRVVESTQLIKRSSTELSAAVEEEMAISTQQAAAVSQITSTMEELSATSTHIAETSSEVFRISSNTLGSTEQGAIAVESLLTKMQEIKDDNHKGVDAIIALGAKSQEISKVMAIINNIADQTKLIAFNAALEASGAGEAGKRFGVVAVEIRRLADSVMESTDEIRSRIKEIQQDVNGLVVSSEKGAKSVQEGMDLVFRTVEILSEIVDGARATTDASKQITLSTQQQKTASQQVVVSLREISEGARQISTSLTQTSSISKSLLEMSDRLNKLVEAFNLQAKTEGDASAAKETKNP